MNLNLVDFNLKYAYSLAFYANNEKIANNLRNVFPYPYFYEDACNFIKTTENTLTKAIKVNVEVVGSISITPQTDEL